MVKTLEDKWQEILERCGFERKGDRKWLDADGTRRKVFEYPDGKLTDCLPPLDLNSIFKWVVPKVRKLVPKGWLTGTLQGIFEGDRDPATALVEAVWKVVKGGK